MTRNWQKNSVRGPSRRNVLATGAAAMLLAAGLGRPAFASGKSELKASVFPPPANGAVKVIDAWGQELASKTSGGVVTTVFPSSQMGPPNRQYDLVRDGVADFSWVLHGFTPGRFPLIDIADLPGLFTNSANGTEALGRAEEYLLPEHKGVRVLGLVASPVLVIMTRGKPVTAVSDVKGLRVRPPSAVAAGAIQALGGTSVAVPPAEMAEALSKGVIDAIVTTAEAAASFRMFEVVKYITDVNMGIATFAFVMNPAAYDGLSGAEKATVDSLSGEAFTAQMAAMFDQTDTAARAMAKESGVEFIQPDGGDADEFASQLTAHREAVVKEMVDKGVKNAEAVYKALQS